MKNNKPESEMMGAFYDPHLSKDQQKSQYFKPVPLYLKILRRENHISI